MKRSIRKISTLFATLLLLASCQNPPPAEESCNFVQNSFKRRVSWARTPVTFYIDKKSFEKYVDEHFDDYASRWEEPTDTPTKEKLAQKLYMGVRQAMDVWNAQFDAPVFSLKGVTDDSKLLPPKFNKEGRINPDTFNAIYFVSRDVFNNSASQDEQARTSISYKGDYIYEADIVVDDSERFYFNDSAMQASGGLLQFKSLMIHEFGHVLGLGHVEEYSVGSVMYPKLQFGEMRPQPQPVVNEEGLKQLDANGVEITKLEIPGIDQDSLACEYK